MLARSSRKVKGKMRAPQVLDLQGAGAEVVVNHFPVMVARGGSTTVKTCPRIRVAEGHSIAEAERLHAASNCELCRMNRSEF